MLILHFGGFFTLLMSQSCLIPLVIEHYFQGKGKKPEIATAIAPYQATSAEQLDLERGQLIMIRKKTSTGWWEGELQAKGKKRQVGWFPASYVKLLGAGGSNRSTPVSHKHQEEQAVQQQQQQLKQEQEQQKPAPTETIIGE